MRKATKFIFLILFFYDQACFGISLIKKVEDVGPVLDMIDKLHAAGEKDVWVLFDLDETLVRQIDACFNSYHEKIFNERLEYFKEFFGYTRPFMEVKLEVLSQMKEDLADPLIRSIIGKIKEYGFRSIILTACGFGAPVAGCKKIEELRWNHLNMALNPQVNQTNTTFGPFFMDYDFVSNFFDGDGVPFFYKDMIFCGQCPKGAAVIALLRLMHMNGKPIPKHILFVDNILDNIISVADAVAGASYELKMDINFYGFEYTLWNAVPLLDMEEMDAQMIHFFAKKKWFSCIDPVTKQLKKECPAILHKQLRKNKRMCCCSVM